MHVGVQYYRKPSPPRERWERDLKVIKEHGVDLVRFWILWESVNPAEGIWVWNDFDEVFDLAHKNGLKVLVQFGCFPPPWKAKQWLEKYGCNCFDFPECRREAEDYFARIVERYGNHPTLMFYDIWNEPGTGGIDHCEHNEKRIQDFLKTKFGSIDKLNQAWNSLYHNFDQIEGQDINNNIEFYEYLQHSQAALMRWRYDTMRKLDPSRPLASHGHGNGSFLIFPDQDQWLFTDTIDAWGCGFYEYDIHNAGLHFNGCRCAGKPWWLSECQCGSHWYNVGYYQPKDNFLKSLFMLAMSFSASGVIFWQWAPQMHDRHESPHFGFTGLDGELNSRTEMLKSLTGMVKRHSDVFDKMSFPEAQIGLLWDSRMVMYDEFAGNVHFNREWLRNFEGWHNALLESSYPFDILNARLVAGDKVPGNLKVLIAPGQVFTRYGLDDRLREWVENGGTLIAGPMYELYKEDMFCNSRYPHKWFGVKQREFKYPENIRAEFVPEEFKVMGPLKGSFFVGELEPEDAEVIATFEGVPVLTRKKVGKGSVFYMGTFFGIEYNFETSPSLQGLLQKLATDAGLTRQVGGLDGCISRLASCGQDKVLFLSNPRKSKANVCLTHPNLEGTLVDLFTDEILGKLNANHKFIHLPIESEDSRVILVRTKNTDG